MGRSAFLYCTLTAESCLGFQNQLSANALPRERPKRFGQSNVQPDALQILMKFFQRWTPNRTESRRAVQFKIAERTLIEVCLNFFFEKTFL